METLLEKIQKVNKELRECIDLTIKIRAESPHNKIAAMKIWEEFLGSFFGYVKQRSKESKDNLLSGMSWTRLKIF